MMKLSVIVPVYNTEKYLDECIQSVRGQSFTDWELILVNDGSTDSSLEICSAFANQDRRIKVFDIPNGGQSKARNLALDHVSGDYIMFLDSDDLFLDNDTFGKSVAYMERHSDVDIAQFPTCRFKDGETPDVNVSNSKEIILNSKQQFIEATDIVTSSIHAETVIPTAPWGKIFRKKIFTNIRFPEGIIYEDTFLFCDIFAKINVYAIVNAGLYGNRERMGSTTRGTADMHKMSDKLKAFTRILCFLNQYSNNDSLKAHFYLWMLNLIAYFKAKYGSRFIEQIDLSAITNFHSTLANGNSAEIFVNHLSPTFYLKLRSIYYSIKQLYKPV